MVMQTSYIASAGYADGNRSGRMWRDKQWHQQRDTPVPETAPKMLGGKHTLRSAWDETAREDRILRF